MVRRKWRCGGQLSLPSLVSPFPQTESARWSRVQLTAAQARARRELLLVIRKVFRAVRRNLITLARDTCRA